MPNRYSVTTFDVCVPGTERLRNRDEFIVCAYAFRGASADDLARDWTAEIDSFCEFGPFPLDSDHAAARACVVAFARSNADAIAKACADLDPVDPDSDDEGCTAYLFIADAWARDEHGRLTV